MTDTISILQLSDTHFLDDGAEAEGGGAYNTSEAFDAVFDHIGDHEHLDMVVVTGDVADHGKAGEYRKAADAFSRFRVPVNVCRAITTSTRHSSHALLALVSERPA